MRSRAEPLAARILRDMPGYTVHDISHLDALWETASLVASDEMSMNPPEGFVFGAAVLLHDAAMTLAAYPGGVRELQQTTEWQDIAALHRKGVPPDPDNLIDNRAVLVDVLRLLHASKAQELATQGWPVPGSSLKEWTYLIEESDLRDFYGVTIGEIAHSHWWPIARVERDLDRYLGPLPPITHHRVDLLKLAGLLRVADVLHLDRRRAPPFVRVLDKPTGISQLHWDFQGRLSFPHLQGDSLVFTAGKPFPPQSAAAWWLGYDAIKVADRELRDTDLLFRDKGREGLIATRIKGADDPALLAGLIPVTKWKPVETRIHVSDVPHIVRTLGGSKPYGDDWSAPLRELLQNGMDAIQARRRLQNRSTEFGLIQVGLADVLTSALLDFGSSFWRSARVVEEFPTLASRGMNAIGRYGIGFFSVFMLGEEVRVITRRYDGRAQDAFELRFDEGLRARPILLMADPNYGPIDGGTRVEVKLWRNPKTKDQFKFVTDTEPPEHDLFYHERTLPAASSLAALLARIAPASDVTIRVTEGGKAQNVIAAEDWLTIPALEMCNRVVVDQAFDEGKVAALGQLIRPIYGEENTVVGRCAIWPATSYWRHTGVLTSGGLRVESFPHLLGLVTGDVSNAARSAGKTRISSEALCNWAAQQAVLLQGTNLDDESKALSAEIVLRCGAEIGELPIVRLGTIWANRSGLAELLSKRKEAIVYVGEVEHEDDDDIGRTYFHAAFESSKDVFFIPKLSLTFETRKSKSEFGFLSGGSRLLREFERVVTELWGEQDSYDDLRPVGDVGHAEILRPVNVYTCE